MGKPSTLKLEFSPALTKTVSFDPIYVVGGPDVIPNLELQTICDSQLSSGKPRNRNPERRAGNIVEALFSAEIYSRPAASVLATDRQDNIGPATSAALGADAHEVTHLTVVGEIRRLRLQGENASNRVDQLIGIKLRGRGSRQRQRPTVDVELAIRQTERVPGKNTAGVMIEDGLMMQRMPIKVPSITFQHSQ